MMRSVLMATIASAAGILYGQASEGPVGLLLSAGPEGKILRRGSGLAVAANVGELLFPGDRLTAGKGTVSYLYCPDRSMQTLEGEALFQSTEVSVPKGKIVSRKEVGVCLLPQAVKLGVASQQHAGALVMRQIQLDLKLLSPVGSPVLEAAPKFTWQPADRADAYEIEVMNESKTVVWKTRLERTEVAYPGHAPPLLAPATYTWKVTAWSQGKPIAATESSFRMMLLAERRQIRQQLAGISGMLAQDPSNPGLRLAKAAALETAGMTSAAFEEYRTLAAEWKQTVWLQARLAELQDRLQGAQRDVLSAR